MADKTNYVLVHGAWHGAWCWNRVAPKLIEGGARVFLPTLRGIGERAGDVTPTPTLEDHIQDVLGMVARAAENGRVVLVGHSYAGMLITAAGDRLGDALAHLVYLDAAVPSDGDDFASHIPGLAPEDVARRRAAFTGMAADGVWLAPPPAQMVGVTDPADSAWLAEKLVVEVDGWAFHKDSVRFQSDHDKRNAFARLGFTVLAFTWHDVVNTPITVVEAVVEVLSDRRSAAS